VRFRTETASNQQLVALGPVERTAKRGIFRRLFLAGGWFCAFIFPDGSISLGGDR
jgi:hypothetical protein